MPRSRNVQRPNNRPNRHSEDFKRKKSEQWYNEGKATTEIDEGPLREYYTKYCEDRAAAAAIVNTSEPPLLIGEEDEPARSVRGKARATSPVAPPFSPITPKAQPVFPVGRPLSPVAPPFSPITPKAQPAFPLGYPLLEEDAVDALTERDPEAASALAGLAAGPSGTPGVHTSSAPGERVFDERLCHQMIATSTAKIIGPVVRTYGFGGYVHWHPCVPLEVGHELLQWSMAGQGRDWCQAWVATAAKALGLLWCDALDSPSMHRKMQVQARYCTEQSVSYDILNFFFDQMSRAVQRVAVLGTPGPLMPVGPGQLPQGVVANFGPTVNHPDVKYRRVPVIACRESSAVYNAARRAQRHAENADLAARFVHGTPPGFFEQHVSIVRLDRKGTDAIPRGGGNTQDDIDMNNAMEALRNQWPGDIIECHFITRGLDGFAAHEHAWDWWSSYYEAAPWNYTFVNYCYQAQVQHWLAQDPFWQAHMVWSPLMAGWFSNAPLQLNAAGRQQNPIGDVWFRLAWRIAQQKMDRGEINARRNTI